MLKRAWKLRNAIGRFINRYVQEDLTSYQLSSTEWRQIEYLIELVYPYHRITLSLSTLTGPTVHLVFQIYNALFEHLENSIARLGKKRLRWKQQLKTALEKAEDKLRKYYGQTCQSHGYLYALATILAPQFKLQYFQTEDWQDDNVNWHAEYQEVLNKVFQYYQAKNPGVSSGQTTRQISQFDRALHCFKRRRVDPISEASFKEIETYVKDGELRCFTIQDIRI